MNMTNEGFGLYLVWGDLAAPSELGGKRRPRRTSGDKRQSNPLESLDRRRQNRFFAVPEEAQTDISTASLPLGVSTTFMLTI